MSLLDWIRDLWTAPVPERGFYVHPYKIVPETERPTQAPPKPSDARQSVAPVWPGPGPRVLVRSVTPPEARALAVLASLQFGWGESFAAHPWITEMQERLRAQVTAGEFMEAELEWKRVNEEIEWE